MASKRLTGLMDDFIGGGTPTEEIQIENNTEQKPVVEPIAQTNTKRKSGKKPGRPKKENSSTVNSCFSVDAVLLKKMKYISWAKDIQTRDVMNEAFEKYVADWERKNGNINLPE